MSYEGEAHYYEPEAEQHRLLNQFRTTISECDARERLVLLWAQGQDGQEGYMASVCGGSIRTPGGDSHYHTIGVVHAVGLDSRESTYQLYNQCGTATELFANLQMNQFAEPLTERDLSVSQTARYILTHTHYNARSARGIARYYRSIRSGEPVGLGEENEFTIAPLFAEDSSMEHWARRAGKMIRETRRKRGGAGGQE